MDSCKQEALRLVSELIDAAHGTVLNEDQSREDEARAALLAHIQRGAVPDMYDRIAEAHDASLDEDHTGCRAILKECMRLLAAAPAPDQFRDATKMMAEPADPDPLHLSRILHELAGAASLCWEPRPTGVFDSQQHSDNRPHKQIDDGANRYSRRRSVRRSFLAAARAG
jgi:hypothetical protein